MTYEKKEEEPKLGIDDATWARIDRAFSPRALEVYASKNDFKDDGLEYLFVDKQPEKFVWYKQDPANKILFVAHLDSVQSANWARTMRTPLGPIVYSPVLDDRLGVYVGLHLLPKLGLNYDILLTTDEETGKSTAQNFYPNGGHKDYNWIFSFDRGGKDVVMYDYYTWDWEKKVEACGVSDVGRGANSDIAYLTHLGCKGFNWGVGYRDYHSLHAHASLADTFEMVGYFLNFWNIYSEEHLEHVKSEPKKYDWKSEDRKKWTGYGGDHYGLGGWRYDEKLDRMVQKGYGAPGHYRDSFDDQITLVEAAKEDTEELKDGNPAIRVSQKQRRRINRLVKKYEMWNWPSPMPWCPACQKTTDIDGWCIHCVIDWDSAVEHYIATHPFLDDIGALA